MIDRVHAAAAAHSARLASTNAPAGAASSKSFAGELARFTRSAQSTVKAVARPDNEHTTKVAGHPYARIENGHDKGLYLNQLAGNPREGAVFRLVKRDDRVFHVYGTGKDLLIVEVKAKPKADPATPSGGTTPAAA